MAGSIFIAMLAAVFFWWFSTGSILLVVRLTENFSRLSKLKICIMSSPILLVGLWGVWTTSSNLTDVGSYLAFISALLVWAWIELTFLTGVITGPNKLDCPNNITFFEKFIRAWGTLAYHEISLLAALGAIVYLGLRSRKSFWDMDFYNSVFCEDFCQIEFIFGSSAYKRGVYPSNTFSFEKLL